MSSTWTSTQFPGVRYREHKSRKHGVKRDRYFAIYYRVDGKRREEGLGWASKGWTAKKAASTLAELQEAARRGEGPVTLAEKREAANTKREEAERKRKQQERNAVTFSEFFEKTYFPRAKETKTQRSWSREDSFHRLWIGPVVGNLPFKDISPFHLEKIKKNMLNAGRAPRSVEYCMAVVRQVFNVARLFDIFQGDSPTKKVAKIKKDNRRMRFLSHEEASLLLAKLQQVSQTVHDQALLSLHCGLRFGETAALTWADIDTEQRLLTIRDPKSSRNRRLHMTNTVQAMFQAYEPGEPNDLVFPARGGGRQAQISASFDRAVAELGFNAGQDDPRQRVCFHTLRHTCASWHVMNGESLYTVKEILGHESLSMTERYSHLAPETLRRAADSFEKALDRKAGKVIHINSGEESNGIT